MKVSEHPMAAALLREDQQEVDMITLSHSKELYVLSPDFSSMQKVTTRAIKTSDGQHLIISSSSLEQNGFLIISGDYSITKMNIKNDGDWVISAKQELCLGVLCPYCGDVKRDRNNFTSVGCYTVTFVKCS